MSYHLTLDSPLGPREAYARVRHLWAPVLLESTARAAPGAHPGKDARWSFLAVEPRVVLESRGGDTYSCAGPDEPWVLEPHPPLDALRRALGWSRGEGGRPSTAPPQGHGVPDDTSSPFHGGAIGYFGYELGARLDPVPLAPSDDLGFPEMRFGVYDVIAVWDHHLDRVSIHARPGVEDAAARAEGLVALLRRPERSAEERELPGHDASSPTLTAPSPAVGSTFTREAYEAAVERVRAYIRAGDVFQVNLSHRFEVTFDGDPLTLHGRLATTNPAHFAGLMELGDGRALVSASPERFLRVDGDDVETRPIKGTARRGRDPAEETALRAALGASEKDRAENVMIVDLVRNDLSRVCQDGSVHVPELCALETFPTVTHLVSTVRAKLRPGVDALDAVAAAFPGGSITGAPKLRAMEIIAELEPTRRGPYTGSFGWIGFDGSMDLDIAIRTVLIANGSAYVQVGGAVVLDSDPASEWAETLDKARGLLAALPSAPAVERS